MNEAMIHAANNPVYRRRLLRHRIGIALSVLAMGIGLAVLLWILATLLIKGVGGLSLAMFTHDTLAPGSAGGGLRNAIVGTLMMVGLSTLVSTPIGAPRRQGVLGEHGQRQAAHPLDQQRGKDPQQLA